MLPPDEAQRARERLEKLDHACGCAEATAALAGFVIAYIAVLTWNGLVLKSWWITVLVAVGVAVLGSGVGKAVGLARARFERDRFFADLRQATGEPARLLLGPGPHLSLSPFPLSVSVKVRPDFITLTCDEGERA
jgi:hypothetical protein